MASPRLIVITMVQSKDFPSAWSSLRPLGGQLSADRERIILLNDERDAEIESAIEALPHTTLVCPGRNLGVARGRNVLFRAALERGASFIVSLDDDLYIPEDYLEEIARLAGEEHGDAGILAPTVMDFSRFVDMNTNLIDDRAAADGEIDSTLVSDVLRSGIDPDDESMFYHLGVRNWKVHYLSPRSERGKDVVHLLHAVSAAGGAPSTGPTYLSSDREARAIAADPNIVQPQPVDTLPGGVSVFNGEMLRAIGLCDERFSPFGYEDADLCIRAAEAGYRNLWIPALVVLHDFQSRGRARHETYRSFVLGRSKALLAGSHLSDDEVSTQFVYFVSSYLADASLGARFRPGQRMSSVAAFATGFLEGARMRDAEGISLLDRLTEVSRGHALDTTAGSRWLLTRVPTGGGSMAPVLSGDIAVEGLDTADVDVRVDARFPDGLAIHARMQYSVDVVESGGMPRIGVLSVRASDQGLTSERIQDAVAEMPGSSAGKGLLGRFFTHRSIFKSMVQRLSSPFGTERRVGACVTPDPPIGLEELGITHTDTAYGSARLRLSLVSREDCWR